MMEDSLAREGARTISDEIRSRERRGKSPSPLSKIRFLPPKADVTGPSSLLGVHELDIASPSATIQRKEQGQGIVYYPPENLAEFLDSALVPPVSGRSALISQRTFSNEVTERFYCAFCMRDRPESTRRKFTGNGGCSHFFCKECLEDYLFQRIRVCHHTFHPCPKIGEEGCKAAATSDDIRCIVREDLFEEHRRRLGGLSGPCEACGIKGSRPFTPFSPATTSPRRATATAAVDINPSSCCHSCGSSPTHISTILHGSPRSTSDRFFEKVNSKKRLERRLHIESEKALAEIEAVEVNDVEMESEAEVIRATELTCGWSCCLWRERTPSPSLGAPG